MRRLIAVLVAGGALLTCSPASAQPLTSSTPLDFSRVRLKVGDLIYVTDPERKVEVSGRLTSLSADALSVDGYRFTPRPGLKVERSGDTIWDGAAYGFLIGGVAGITVGAEGCLHRPMVDSSATGSSTAPSARTSTGDTRGERPCFWARRTLQTARRRLDASPGSLRRRFVSATSISAARRRCASSGSAIPSGTASRWVSASRPWKRSPVNAASVAAPRWRPSTARSAVSSIGGSRDTP
jgi:hypothetical protein